MTEITAKTPWAGLTGDVPLHLDYFDGSMFEALELVAKKYPRNIAFDFMGKATTYPQMIEEIKKCARSLKTIGVRAGDKVTIAMPNCPQAIYMFYAVNLVGGIANMIHPLSAEKEIEFYLNESESVTAITLDQFYNKFESIRQNTKVVNIIIASVKDELSKPVRAGYMLTEGRKIAKIPKDAPVCLLYTSPCEIHRRGLALRVGIGRHDDLVDAAGGDALDEGLDLQIVWTDVVHR